MATCRAIVQGLRLPTYQGLMPSRDRGGEGNRISSAKGIKRDGVPAKEITHDERIVPSEREENLLQRLKLCAKAK